MSETQTLIIAGKKKKQAGERAMSKINKRQTAYPLPFILRDSTEV